MTTASPTNDAESKVVFITASELRARQDSDVLNVADVWRLY